MSYTIKIVDINDPVIDLAIRKLIRDTYHSPDLLPEKYLAANLNSKASTPGFFLVAEEDNAIIGCTGFSPNDFSLNGKNCLGFQAFWSVTHPLHQGRKIYTSLINEGKIVAKERGGGFLYAIANPKARKTLITKIGFQDMPALRLRIPNIPFIKGLYFTKGVIQNRQNVCTIDELQVKDHKMAQDPSALKMVQVNESWIWGKRLQKTKFGIRIPVFYVGGIHLADEKDLKGLISGIFKLHKVFAIQFVSCKTNTFNGLMKGWKQSDMIYFNYCNWDMPAFEHFDLMIGALDVF